MLQQPEPLLFLSLRGEKSSCRFPVNKGLSFPMALPSTIYRVSIQLSHIDRNIYESLQTTIAQHPSETAERLVARLMAYALCFEPGLAFTKGVGAGDEPDLWAMGPDGRVLTWIEVGLPDPERLVKASRHSGRVILIACGPSLPRWVEQHLAKLAGIPNLTVIGLDQGLLNQLAARLRRTIAWSLTITEDSLYLGIDGETLEGTITLLSGGPISSP
jgi:uncharacterized protein YaeQ